MESTHKLLVDNDGKVGIQLSGCCDQPKIEVEECDGNSINTVKTARSLGTRPACEFAVQFEAKANTVYLVEFECESYSYDAANPCTTCV
jgi:hypothetical protein